MADPEPGAPHATAVFVTYNLGSLDLGWVPPTEPVVVVRNDRLLALASDPRLRVVDAPTNVGFGAGVNLALPFVETGRVVIANPDIRLTPTHWHALVAGEVNEIVTVPLVDDDGRTEVTAAPYPTALSLVAMALRLGRLAPRGGRVRRLLGRVRGVDGGHDKRGQIHPLANRWASGAVLSIDVSRLRTIGGFDDEYFLYYEDVDLCRRLASAFDGMVVRVADVVPGFHQVGGSATGKVPAHRYRSAITYAERQSGAAWRVATTALRRLARP